MSCIEIEYNYHNAWNMNQIATISSTRCVAERFMGLSIHVHVKARHLRHLVQSIVACLCVFGEGESEHTLLDIMIPPKTL